NWLCPAPPYAEVLPVRVLSVIVRVKKAAMPPLLPAMRQWLKVSVRPTIVVKPSDVVFPEIVELLSVIVAPSKFEKKAPALPWSSAWLSEMVQEFRVMAPWKLKMAPPIPPYGTVFPEKVVWFRVTVAESLNRPPPEMKPR